MLALLSVVDCATSSIAGPLARVSVACGVGVASFGLSVGFGVGDLEMVPVAEVVGVGL